MLRAPLDRGSNLPHDWPMQTAATLPIDPDVVADMFAALALEAGRAIMKIYDRGAQVRLKADSSPVSDADEEAEAVILAGLARACPAIPVVAEESVAKGAHVAACDLFILVDPLDGTREFISRNGEFTVNIGLIHKGAPIAGAVYAPALGRLWIAGRTAQVCDVALGATLPAKTARQTIRVRKPPADGLVALASRSHRDAETEAFLARLPIAECVSAGSSLKFCRLAEGAADVYPRFGTTMEWDVAAGDAVLRAAGGAVRTPSGAPFCYGKSAFRNGPFIAWGQAPGASAVG